MDIRNITEDFAVSPQIAPEDIPAIKTAGFRSILCNRPDDEDYGQPSQDAVAQAVIGTGTAPAAAPDGPLPSRRWAVRPALPGLRSGTETPRGRVGHGAGPRPCAG